ncbi:MAG: carboxymuconolactone decarboxylase family protein [Chitinophagaceae bacterium]
MKMAYYFTKKQLGKVITSIKVHSARLPTAFGMFYAKLPALDKKLKLSNETAMLIRQHVAQLNICLFCMDAGRAAAIRQSMNVAKFDALVHYNDSSLFTAAEKSALDYATELTVDKKVKPGTFAEMAKQYSEREICEIVYLIASEHMYNLTNIGLNIHSDMLCDLAKNN